MEPRIEEQLPPLDVLREICTLLDPTELAAFAASSGPARSAIESTCASVARARFGLRVRLRHARAALAHRAEFVRRDTGRRALLAPAAALESVVARLERAPHGLSDLLAATQKALTSVENQDLVAPARLARVRQDLTHAATLACLVAWRQGARERRRELQEAAAPPPHHHHHHHHPAVHSDTAAAAGGAARGVQTPGMTLGDVRELAGGVRALAGGGGAGPRLSGAALNLLDHYLGREAGGGGDAGGGGGGVDVGFDVAVGAA
ncbi:MAG: hypothetical protein J3K34DRAFT_522710 [Monoraphidium minutum]|nr:MAG: hypothetical protein J3K34DRAFT_522710 [Monoraphidium minutum]